MNNQEREHLERVYEEFFAYLDGDAPRPNLSELPDDVVAELETIETVGRISQNVDIEMIPDFESDPVALQLGFRSGLNEKRISGGALTDARARRGLSAKDLARIASTMGVTVTPADITAIEKEVWSTTASSIVQVLASALEIDERDLRIRRPTLLESVTNRLIGLGLPLQVAGDPDPVLDATSGRCTSLVVSYLDLRVRVVLLDDIKADGLGDEEVLSTAQRVLRTAGDTSAVALIADDEDNTARIIEPADVAPAIAVPTGRPVRFLPARAAAPLEMAFQEFFERLVPQWDALDTSSPITQTDDWEDLVLPEATRFIATASASRFKIVEKKTAYSSLDTTDAPAIAYLVRAIADGIKPDDLFARLNEMAEISS